MTTKERVYAYKDEIIASLARLVKYNSVEGTPTEAEPFGPTCAAVLKEALSMMEEHGLKTTNLDNYIGFGEIGEGDKLVGVLGHLDIVPAGEGWNTDPFTVTEKDGKLYGRGTSDDKGAMVASMYALQILQDEGYKFNKRVRLITGTNEETGSKCLAHYVEKEGHFDYGFTPDANFPGVYGEKGMVSARFSCNDSKIISVNGGEASNVVCNKCTTVLPNGFCDFDKVKQYLEKENLEYTLTDVAEGKELVVRGVAAHASTPYLGRNAISYTFQALAFAGSDDPLVTKYNALIGLATDGSNCNIKYEDKYGALTFNNGVIKTTDEGITGTIDIRTGLLVKSEEIAERMQKAFDTIGLNLQMRGLVAPLFYEPNTPWVQAMVKAYRDVTGDMDTQPMTIGGGTYAKGINNCIGFGCEFVGDDNHIHDANEFVKISDLLLQVEIYVETIKNLCEL